MQNDTSTINSIDDTMSKLSPKTLRKTKTKKAAGGRVSPAYIDPSSVVNEDDDFESDSLPVPSVTTKQPVTKQ